MQQNFCCAFLAVSIVVVLAVVSFVVPSVLVAAENGTVSGEIVSGLPGHDFAACSTDASTSSGPCTVKTWRFAASLALCAVGMFPIAKAYRVLKAGVRALRAGEKWGAAIGSFFCADAWLSGWDWAECVQDSGMQDGGSMFLEPDVWSVGGGASADASWDLADALDAEAESLLDRRRPGDPW